MILIINFSDIIVSLSVFLVVILMLTLLLLVAKRYLVPSGNVKIMINDDKQIELTTGNTLLNALAQEKIFLASACGGGGSCAQCRVQIPQGGGEILPTEIVHFSRKEIKDQWRLGCQVKVRNDMAIKIDESILGVKKWECEVVSNNNVATFIKEFVVKLPQNEQLNFVPGSYIQIDIPAYQLNYSNFEVDERFKAEWDKFNLWSLSVSNTNETMRAYSMANYPAEGDIVMLNVRIATPPFDKVKGTWMNVKPGIASSYIFNLKQGDKVTISGPFGDFHPLYNSNAEMLYIGGGAGMAPLRSHLLHLLKTLETKDRKISYFYGARALNEVFYMDEFLSLEKQFSNFSFHLALDKPDAEADKNGVKYTTGYVHQVILDTYLINHDAPEDIEYYMCGPGPMAKAVENMLWSLGVPRENLMFDDFGA